MLALERAGQGFRDGWNGDLAHHMDLAHAKIIFFREMVLPGYCIIECLYIWIFLVEVCDITGTMVFG